MPFPAGIASGSEAYQTPRRAGSWRRVTIQRFSSGTDGDWRALYDGEYKVLWNSLGRHGLYRVSTDPAETNELSRTDPERAAAMLRRLEEFVAALPVAEFPDEGATPLDPETMEMLRSLGYVQ